MFGFLKSVGAIFKTSPIYLDLSRLNEAGSKLGDKATEYVKTGNGGSILSTLSNKPDLDKYLHPTQYDSKLQAPTRARQKLFVDMDPYDPAMMARYAEVLTAVFETGRYESILAGSKTMDLRLRVFFGQAFHGAVSQTNQWPQRPREEPIKGLTPAMAIEVGKHLDCKPEDVVAVLLWADNTYTTRQGHNFRARADMKSLFTNNAELVVRATSQLGALGLVSLIEQLVAFDLCENEPYLSLILQNAGASAKSLRDAASNALLSVSAKKVEGPAIKLLAEGSVSARTGIVTLLSALGTDTAMAALSDRRKIETTARVKSAIENALATSGSSDTAVDTQTSYTAIDGTTVTIPPMAACDDDPTIVFGKDMHSRIEKVISEINENNAKVNKSLTEIGQKYGHRYIVRSPRQLAQSILDMFNTGKIPEDVKREVHPFYYLRQYKVELFNEMMDQVPIRRQIAIANGGTNGSFNIRWFGNWNAPATLKQWLASDEGDLRLVEDVLLAGGSKFQSGNYRNRKERQLEKGDLLAILMPEDRWSAPDLTAMSAPTIWPLVAQNFDVMDQALGLAPKGDVGTDRLFAVQLLQRMPKTPMRYFGPVLEIATGEGKAGRAEARSLLQDVPQVDDRLIALLDDSRQAIRAGAAEWLAERKYTAAIKPLEARLKKEKSELALAAMLTALLDLGEDISRFVGPAVLIKEAEEGMKKAKMDKLAYLQLDHLPKLKWTGGKPVPDDVIKWWLMIANKLKQPSGNALFEIYLDQLEPASAETLSTWVFDSWIAFDTRQPDESEGIAHAKANVKTRFAQMSRWWKDLTEDAMFLMLKREITGQYLNSGAATKGILGLATRIPSATAADKVRMFLRDHGKRTSQATSLLELLAAKGDAVSLQVVISAATRLKQKGVQEKAGEMIQAVAEARGWTMQELADRTIPTGGLDDDGIVELPCGPDEKLYRARLGDDLQLILTNPDGKIIKALPAGDDENTSASKKQLTTSKKEIKQVIKAQSDRLYEGLCAERDWPVADWTRDFEAHPVMRRLIERVIWIGLNDAGKVIGSFRPTSDGGFTDAEDAPVVPSGFASIRLAHAALLPEADAKAWIAHLKDYEIKTLFGQFGRPLLRPASDKMKTETIVDRQGWVTDAFTVRGTATKLGYERGEALDGGFFCEYTKSFKAAGITAVIEFSGNGLPEENVAAAIKTLSFTSKYQGYNVQRVPLEKVPPVLLSECWNDYHDLAAKAKFDPDWERKMPW